MSDPSPHPRRPLNRPAGRALSVPALLMLQGCGGGGAGAPESPGGATTGLPAGYVPPPSPYQPPTVPDPEAFVLRPDAVAP